MAGSIEMVWVHSVCGMGRDDMICVVGQRRNVGGALLSAGQEAGGGDLCGFDHLSFQL